MERDPRQVIRRQSGWSGGSASVYCPIYSSLAFRLTSVLFFFFFFLQINFCACLILGNASLVTVDLSVDWVD